MGSGRARQRPAGRFGEHVVAVAAPPQGRVGVQKQGFEAGVLVRDHVGLDPVASAIARQFEAVGGSVFGVGGGGVSAGEEPSVGDRHRLRDEAQEPGRLARVSSVHAVPVAEPPAALGSRQQRPDLGQPPAGPQGGEIPLDRRHLRHRDSPRVLQDLGDPVPSIGGQGGVDDRGRGVGEEGLVGGGDVAGGGVA